MAVLPSSMLNLSCHPPPRRQHEKLGVFVSQLNYYYAHRRRDGVSFLSFEGLVRVLAPLTIL